MTDWWQSDPVVSQSPNGSGEWWKNDPVVGGAAAKAQQPGAVEDVAKSTAAGLGQGAIGLAGLAGDASRLLDYGPSYLIAKGAEKLGLLPNGKTASDLISDAQKLDLPRDKFAAPTSGDIKRVVEQDVTGPFHEPQTTAGKYAKTAAEFVPVAAAMPGNVAANALKYGVAPGVGSEAAGQAFEGTQYEPYARFAGAVAGGAAPIAARSGVAAALGKRGVSQAAKEVASSVSNMTQEQFDAALQLMRESKATGVPLTFAEAAQHVTGGATKAADLQRVIEGHGGLTDFMSERPAQIEAAGRRAISGVAPAAQQLSALGQDAQRTATGIIESSPQGQKLAGDVWRAGERVTPEQVGSVIRPELRSLYEGREGMRNALASPEYEAARAVPEPNPLGPGSGLSENAGKVNTRTVVQAIDKLAETAKGGSLSALRGARKMLYAQSGKLDTSVAGAHGARTAIDDLISQAKTSGENNTARLLSQVKEELDRSLEASPEYGRAVETFRNASKPLAPFENPALAKVIERDQFNQGFVLPDDQVASAIEKGGASAAQQFSEVASPAARDAYVQHLTTQALDKSGRNGLEISSDALRTFMQQNEDALRRFPEVGSRLESIANSRDALENLMQGPIGKLAKSKTSRDAVNAIFNPDNGANEVFDAVQRLSGENVTAARRIVRAHVEGIFDQATRDLQAGANQFGGATFRSKLIGNRQDAGRLAAALKALPDGDAILGGFDKLLNVLEATGQRQRIGSQTAFNTEMQQSLKSGGVVGEGASLAAGGGIKIPSRIKASFEKWNLGRNVNEIAKLLTDPHAVAALRSLSKAKRGSKLEFAAAIRAAVLALPPRNEQ